MCLAACNRHVHRLTKPFWRLCFLGSCIGGGSASLTAFILETLKVGGDRLLR
jgi:hypothetical protein